MDKDWIHLELYFKDYNEITEGIFPQQKPNQKYKELIRYLKAVIDNLSGLIDRYFFLFEQVPHLFLSLEVKDMNNIELVKRKITSIGEPLFVESSEIKLRTGDGGHPGPVIDFFKASSNYAFFRADPDYRPGYYNHDETKLIHCFCNQLFVTWENEKLFYAKGLFLRGYPLNQVISLLKESNLPEDKINDFLTFDRSSAKKDSGVFGYSNIKNKP
ncbi:MAG: hypothetical protein ACM3IL_04520 [Deltaproteobacteria bacterium]